MPPSRALAFKAYEIEEFVDVYFYRRLGYLVACAARAVRLSPNAVSVVAGVIGAVGGLLIAWPRLDWTGIALLVLHGIVDSADGQLARMTGQTSELGRVLDGISGYATHIAIYVAIIIGVHNTTGGWAVLGPAFISGACTAIQAQLYDYHRTAFGDAWTDDNDTIRLTVQGRKLSADGAAYAGTASAPAGTPPDAAMGGSAAPHDNFVLFERKQGRHDCIVSLTLMGDALEVVDNADCGAAKASFDGEYHRAK